MTDLTQG
jgi:phosphoribosylcarboxyaminoimidazole (NCAIR) mutase